MDEARLSFVDEGVKPSSKTAITRAGFELLNLRFGQLPRKNPGQPGNLRIWLEAPGIVRKLEASGPVRCGPTQTSLEFALAAQGVSAQALAPYLAAAGLESTLENGSLALTLTTALEFGSDSMAAELKLEDLKFEDRGTELLGLDALRIARARLSSAGLQVGEVEVRRPRFGAERDAEGRLTTLGLRTLLAESTPPAEPTPPASAETPATAPETIPATTPDTSTEAQVSKAPKLPKEAEASAETRFALEKFRIVGAEARWRDKTLPQEIETRVVLDVAVDDLHLDGTSRSASFQLQLAVDGALDWLQVEGALTSTPERDHARIAVEARGLRAGPLEAYIPAGIESLLKDGSLRLRLEAESEAGSKGETLAHLAVTDFDYRDEGTEPWLAFESLRGAISQVPASLPGSDGGAIAVKEVSIAALEGRVLLTEEGVQAGGLLFEAATPPTPATAPNQETPAPSAPTAGREVHPHITLEKLDLGLKRLHVANSAPGSEPLVLEDFRVHNPAPWSLLGAQPEDQPPLQLELSGKLAPLIERFEIAAQAAPFAAIPRLEVQLGLHGIRGAGLTEHIPEMAATIDGAGLEAGELSGRLEVSLEMKRRDPARFEFEKPFGGEVVVQDLFFRRAPEGQILAGLEGLRLDVTTIRPATGDIHVKEIEIIRPVGHVRQLEAGFEMLGLIFKTEPESEAEPETAAARRARKDQERAAREEATEAATDEPPAAEIRVDRLLVSDVAFTFEDTVSTPPLELPLTTLELEVRDFTTRAFVEERPVRFSALLGAGTVRLSKALAERAQPEEVTDATPSVEGEKVTAEFDERAAFQEIAASGRLAFFPRPSGWVKANVSALELPTLKGLAAGAGITLEEGVFDARLDARFQEDGSLITRSRFDFTDLEVSEPPDGPIFSSLHLPAPLDTILFVLRDENGAVEIPLNFEVSPDGELSAAQVWKLGMTTLTGLSVNALASSPLRVAGTLTALVPGTGEDDQTPEETISFAFSPGTPGLSQGEAQRLAGVIERLENDERLVLTVLHELGAEDVELAGRWANPSAADSHELTQRLRHKRKTLTERRALAHASARAAFGAGLGEPATTARNELREIEKELGLTERALDQVLALLRPGAERQADRRTRNACTVLVQRRLNNIQQAFQSAGLENLEERVRLLPARFKEPTAPQGGTAKAVLSVRKER